MHSNEDPVQPKIKSEKDTARRLMILGKKKEKKNPLLVL